MLQFIVIFVLLMCLVGFGVNWNRSNQEQKLSLNGFAIGLFGLLLIGWIGVSPAFGIVPAGHRGVVLQFGGVTGKVLDEGLYFLIPFVNSVELMDVQTHAYGAKAVEAASHDLQTIHTDVVVNYRLDPSRAAEIYQNLRHDYELRIMAPAVQEAVKANTAHFEAEKLITERPRVKAGIDEDLIARLAKYGLIVHTINITNFAFSKEFENAIESKVIAEQLELKARNDLKRIEVEKNQAIERATGEAEAIRIRATALQANAQLVQLEAVQKWDGHLPQYMLGDTVPFLQVNR